MSFLKLIFYWSIVDYNVVLVFAVKHRESDICVRIHHKEMSAEELMLEL